VRTNTREYRARDRSSSRVDAPPASTLVSARYGLLILACLTAVMYFQWRLGVMNPAYPVYSWIVFAAEIVGFARLLMFLLLSARVSHRETPPAPPADLAVDVFVTTCSEPLDVVRRTILAALAIRYPHETWLLDDGARAEMRDLARDTGCRYLARTEHNDAKAGNLNHALSFARGEFVAVFDADHVADPRFLDRTLGYFSDPRVAVVQTPQEFFNVDSFEHLITKRNTSNGASFFHRVVQRSHDRSNATFFTGSSGVLRRRALDAIAGFATGTIAEDVHTSLRLHAAGWHSRFHPEILAAGLGPLDAAGYCGQRLRWAQDALQLLLRENLVVHPGLTWRQRQTYLIHVASNLEGWRHLFIYALPIVILATGILPVRTDATSFLQHFAPYFLVAAFAYTEFARGHGRLDESAVYNLARAPAAILAPFTIGERRFLVTPKTRSERRSAERTFTYALLLGTLAAGAYACAAALAGRSPFATATLAVLGTWAAYHVVTAMRLLMLERRCAHERRATTRFADEFAASIARCDDPQARFAVDVAGACADGFTLRGRPGAPSPPAGAYRGEFDLAGAHFSFEIALGEGHLGGAVRWADATTRAAFDLLLHQRAIARLSGTDQGDRGGVLGAAGISRRRYPKPRLNRA